MARATSWRDLWLGPLALLVVVVGGGAVLRFARVGALHGETVPLYAATPHARGLLPGSEVWLDGQKVGVVRGVGFRPSYADTVAPVLLSLEVLSEALPLIRHECPDAWCRKRAGHQERGRPWCPVGGACSVPCSGGEAGQRASHVALAQPLERAVAQLADALAGHAEHRADLL